MKANELANAMENVAKNYKTHYMWGMWGQPITEEAIAYKVKQFPKFYTKERQKKARSLIGKGYYGFDCVCTIKAILWGWNGNAKDKNGGAVYASNGVADKCADDMFALCKEKSADFSNVEIGEALWTKGHIGVYIGNGLAVECTTAWKGNVQITAVANIGSKPGYNARRWTKHGKLPYVTYEQQKGASLTNTSTTTKPASNSLKKGDKVKVLKNVQYNGKTFKVYYSKYDVLEARGDRIVIGIGSKITCAINSKNLQKV